MCKTVAVGMMCLLGFSASLLAQDVSVVGEADPRDGGKVTGTSFVKPGKSATLSASPAKGWAFTEWQDGLRSAKRVVSYAEAVASTNEHGDAMYTATFIKIVDLPKPVVTAVDGVVTGMVGVAFSPLPIGYTSLCAATLTASKLPGGLTLKDGVITGVPKKAETVAVTLVAANPAGKSPPVQVTILILPLPLSAQGTFTGFFMEENQRPAETPGEVVTNYYVTGTFSMTVSTAGKISAKVVTGKGKASFTATSWDEKNGSEFTVELKPSKGQERLALTLYASAYFASYQLGGTVSGGAFEGTDWSLSAQKKDFNAKSSVLNDWSGASQLLFDTCYCVITKPLTAWYYNEATQKVSYAVSTLPKASYNVWLFNEEMSALGNATNAPQGNGYLTLTVKPDGAVKFAGKLADGKAVSGSTTALPQEDFIYYYTTMPVYVPMYGGRGSFSAPLLIYTSPWFRNPTQSPYVNYFTDMPARWAYPGKSPAANPPQAEDAFEARLGTWGSLYSPLMPVGVNLEQNPTNPPFGFYLDSTVFTADAPDVPYTYTKGSYTNTVNATAGLLPTVQLNVAKMTLQAGNANPAKATFSVAKASGVFKGKFNVYYDYTDENGAVKQKAVPVKHEGVLLPYFSASTDATPPPGGAGFYLMSDTWVDKTNPAKPVTYKLNRSFGATLQKAP